MTNMATMPVHGKNLKVSSAMETGLIALKFDMYYSVGYWSSTKTVQIMTLG